MRPIPRGYLRELRKFYTIDASIQKTAKFVNKIIAVKKIYYAFLCKKIYYFTHNLRVLFGRRFKIEFIEILLAFLFAHFPRTHKI